jgi:Ni/Co efflux regulator RcnB
MNHIKTLASALLVAAIALPAISMAQDRDDKHDDRRTEQRHDEQRHDERGAGPDHSWHKGDRVPAEYRNKRYEVSDWKAHNLRRPPSGYHWVNVNGDYVLAAVATGVIADMLLNQ